MKMLLLKILAVLIGLVVLLCVIAVFVKKDYTIKRETLINTSVDNVYNYVRYHKNQKEFNHWISLDPTTTIEIRGSEDGTSGSIMYFESNNKKVGKGEWENTHLVQNEQIELELRFLAPYKFTAHGTLYFVDAGANNSKLIWEYKSGMDWPMNITLLFMDMDKIIGKDIEATLEKIKFNTEIRVMSFQTYLKNIQEKTGKSPSDFEALAAGKGFTEKGKIKTEIKATEIINWLKEDFDLGHGHATAIYAYVKGKRK